MANLDRYASRGKRKIDFTQENPFKDTALGLVSTKSFPAIVGTADMMLKSAEVTMVGYEKVGWWFARIGKLYLIRKVATLH